MDGSVSDLISLLAWPSLFNVDNFQQSSNFSVLILSSEVLDEDLQLAITPIPT